MVVCYLTDWLWGMSAGEGRSLYLFLSDKETKRKPKKRCFQLRVMLSLAQPIMSWWILSFLFHKVKVWKERHIVYAFSQNRDFKKIYIHIIYRSWNYVKPIKRHSEEVVQHTDYRTAHSSLGAHGPSLSRGSATTPSVTKPTEGTTECRWCRELRYLFD